MPGSALHTAANKGIATDVEHLIKADPSIVNGKDGVGWTALHHAAKAGHLNVVKILVVHKADVNASASTTLYTPLHFACEGGYTDMVFFLVAKGARINAPSKTGATPLMKAAAYERLETCMMLVDLGADTKLLDKDGNDCIHVAEYAIRPRLTIYLRRAAHGPELLQAATRGDWEALPRLIDAKVPLTFRDPKTGYTALHIAATTGDIPVAKILLKSGASLTATDFEGHGPLIIALARKETSFAEFLIKRAGISFESGLFAAAINNQGDLAKWLVERGANLNTLDPDGNAPIHLAVTNESLDVLRVIVGEKADLGIKDPHGNTALHLVVKAAGDKSTKPQRAMAEMLMHAGASLDAEDKFDMTPLEICKDGRLKSLLKSMVPDPAQAVTMRGKSPSGSRRRSSSGSRKRSSSKSKSKEAAAAAGADTATGPTVFVSYRWWGKLHDQVRALTEALKPAKVLIDDHVVNAAATQWEAWMEQSLKSVDYILVVCTKEYRERTHKSDTGVGYEYALLKLHWNEWQDKVIPVFMDDYDKDGMLPLLVHKNAVLNLMPGGSTTPNPTALAKLRKQIKVDK